MMMTLHCIPDHKQEMWRSGVGSHVGGAGPFIVQEGALIASDPAPDGY
jgi:hypothetical protein